MEISDLIFLVLLNGIVGFGEGLFAFFLLPRLIQQIRADYPKFHAHHKSLPVWSFQQIQMFSARICKRYVWILLVNAVAIGLLSVVEHKSLQEGIGRVIEWTGGYLGIYMGLWWQKNHLSHSQE